MLVLDNENSIRCKQCTNFRATLRVRNNRLQRRTESRTEPSSSVPYCVLSKEEMQTRMKNLHCELRKIQKQRARQKQIVEAAVDKHGITLDEEIHNDLKQIIKTENSELFNTFQKVFWQQQVHAAFKDDARGMRWHPLMIKWCIYLRHQSQSAYETLRHSKCISLPSQRTLRDCTHHIKPTPGFSADVDVQLYSAAKLHQCEGREKYVILIIDEMHVKEDLVFDKHSGELIGFTNIGEINSQLLALEQSLNNETHPVDIPLASSMMTFMVRGLFSHLQFPYAYFPCRNVTGDLLFDPLWEAVCRLERSGFKVKNTNDNCCCQMYIFIYILNAGHGYYF